jgi:hypothetical protein
VLTQATASRTPVPATTQPVFAARPVRITTAYGSGTSSGRARTPLVSATMVPPTCPRSTQQG